MIFYVVLDTNVIVSSLLSSHDDASTVQVVGKLLNGEIIPVFSNEIIQEYKEVLHRKKFNFDAELVDKLIMAIQQFGIYLEPKNSGEVLPDMKDLPFYEIVLDINDKNKYLVTGNIKHFPNKPFIVTPTEFLKIYNEKK